MSKKSCIPYRWESLVIDGYRATRLYYKGYHIGSVYELNPNSFRAYKLDEFIGHFPTVIAAQDAVQSPRTVMSHAMAG